MKSRLSPEYLAEALARAHEHWQIRHDTASETPSAFTIAVSREVGTYGAAIAREVGNRLGWPVYDRELLQQIADDMGVQRVLLESIDERKSGWLTECLEGFMARPSVSANDYVRLLVKTLLSLAAHGECVIVGRGATAILPRASTLRVRVVAPLGHRIEAVRRERGISHEEARQEVETKDRERNRFVASNFDVDAADARNYDLVLNAARFSVEESASLVLAALDHLRRHPNGAPHPVREAVGAL